MNQVRYIDRIKKTEEIEKIYGHVFIELLYGNNFFSRFLYKTVLPLFAKVSFLSKLNGWYQASRFSRRKIKPFIHSFHVDTQEFLEPVSSFDSFNDFFIRKLKPESRPMALGNDIAVLPADGRYLVFPDVLKSVGFFIKGQKFNLDSLIGNDTIAHKYHRGSMVIARLCPVDYHRFHFPCDGVPDHPKLINGYLYSVNPIALKRNIDILTENKRILTQYHTKNFGTILYIEIGATYVGSIHQTFMPNVPHVKGDEKGYFAFGGSCVIMLFEPFRIEFDQDLLDASARHIEVRGHLGQSLGKALKT